MKKSLLSALPAVLLPAVAIPLQAAEGGEKRPQKQKDNLIFILVDQLRFDALSCMGNTVISTPNLDKLASEGVLFRNAYSECPVSVPARASLLTGCSIYNTGVTCNRESYSFNGDLSENAPIRNMKTYDEVLISNGYAGEYYGKWHSPELRAFAYQNRPIGLAGANGHKELGTGLSGIYANWLEKVAPEKMKEAGDIYYKSMERYYAPDPFDPLYNSGTPDKNQKGQVYSMGLLRVTDKQTRTAMDSQNLMEAIYRLRDTTFTVHCSYGPPHPPLLVCDKYHSMLDPDDMKMMPNYEAREQASPYYSNIIKGTYFQNPYIMKYMVKNYWVMVKELDDWLGQVFQAVENAGIKDRTMIVFLADHGEMLGAHGLNGKANFYEEAARVPMIVSFPGKIPAGTVVNAPVNSIGIYATILDYLGVQEGQTHRPDEPSLRRFIEDKKLADSKDVFAVSEWPSDVIPGEMIRTAEWKLMIGRTENAKSVDALYDMVNDPYETTNLLAGPNGKKYLKIARDLQKKLVENLEYRNSPYANSVKNRTVKCSK